jgi:hypothetical protein
MKHGRLADFFFVGLGIVPPALMFGGLPHLAILLFVPLLFIACLFGMAEQVETSESSKEIRVPGRAAGATPAPKQATGITLRDRSSPDDLPKT